MWDLVVHVIDVGMMSNVLLENTGSFSVTLARTPNLTTTRITLHQVNAEIEIVHRLQWFVQLTQIIVV